MKRIVGEDGALIAKPVNREGTVTVVTCARSVSRRCDVFLRGGAAAVASICGRRVLKLFLGQHAVGDMPIGRGEANQDTSQGQKTRANSTRN